MDEITAFKRGDEGAFRAIVESWHRQVQALLAGRGVPLEDVPAVAQDVFIFVFDHIDDFTEGTNFRAWLFAIARNKARAWHEVRRRDVRNKENALAHFLQQQLRWSGSRSDGRMEALAICMEKLNDPVRDMLEQRYAGVSISELARNSHRSESAVKMALLRTREVLRDCVSKMAVP